MIYTFFSVSEKASSLRARFENIATVNEDERRKAVDEQKQKRKQLEDQRVQEEKNKLAKQKVRHISN